MEYKLLLRINELNRNEEMIQKGYNVGDGNTAESSTNVTLFKDINDGAQKKKKSGEDVRDTHRSIASNHFITELSE